MLSPFRLPYAPTRAERRSLPKRWTLMTARRWLWPISGCTLVVQAFDKDELTCPDLFDEVGPASLWYRSVFDP